ncbi:MAG: ATP-binding protein [Spartobacteria bacterium]|nr:ATP-binding protein [Spartobacteria bacterium]
MINRNIESVVRSLSAQFGCLGITGPRQSGKTTLARMIFPDKPYVSLETPDERMMATRDPRRFLARFPAGCILDEVQRAPDLFSYLQEIIDAHSEPGRFILTGSQQFGMMEKITQTLAGRIGILTLLPFSVSELNEGTYLSGDLNQVLWQGSYPPVFDRKIDPILWYDSYITTYVERDVRQMLNVKDIQLFQRFLGLCAGNIGQLFNASRISNDCGINHGTVSHWLSVLEASYVAFRLQPHHRNYRKRIVKTPKLYFWDTGLVIRLLGIENASQLRTHPLRGPIFENWVITELMKGRFNRGRRSNLFFWRNNTGLEVDVVAEQAGRLMPIEIKSGATLSTDWFATINKWLSLAGNEAINPTLIYGGAIPWGDGPVRVIPWSDISTIADAV